MPYALVDNEWVFQWEAPATVVAVVDGATFLADIDLGWGVHVRTLVASDMFEVDPIDTPDGLAAKKEAQRLLKDAQLTLRCKRIEATVAVCSISYSPYFTSRAEQASFAAAMLASGYARTIE